MGRTRACGAHLGRGLGLNFGGCEETLGLGTTAVREANGPGTAQVLTGSGSLAEQHSEGKAEVRAASVGLAGEWCGAVPVVGQSVL